MSKRVALLMGGRSAEREVSLVTGRDCAAGLRQKGYDVEVVDVSDDMSALLAALEPRPDVVFNALHGRFGEDGRVQGLLDLIGVPYTHSGVLASALAMDKPLAKQVFGSIGLRCPEGKVISLDQLAKGDPLARPFVVKPTAEGSSVGVRIVRNGDNLPPLGSSGWPFGHDVLVERYIPGRELTVAVMGDRPLGVIEIVPQGTWYDYDAKYAAGGSKHIIPAAS